MEWPQPFEMIVKNNSSNFNCLKKVVNICSCMNGIWIFENLETQDYSIGCISILCHVAADFEKKVIVLPDV